MGLERFILVFFLLKLLGLGDNHNHAPIFWLVLYHYMPQNLIQVVASQLLRSFCVLESLTMPSSPRKRTCNLSLVRAKLLAEWASRCFFTSVSDGLLLHALDFTRLPCGRSSLCTWRLLCASVLGYDLFSFQNPPGGSKK